MMMTPVLLVATSLTMTLPPQTQARPVLMSGTSAEMFGAGLRFGTLIGAQINETGQIMTYGVLEGPGVTDDNDSAFVLIDHGNVMPIVRDGRPSPFGAPVGTMYQIGNSMLANDSTVYFDAKINVLNPPARPDGFWKYDHGSLLRLLADEQPVGDSDFVVQSFGTAQVSANGGAITSGFLQGPAGIVDGMFGERDGLVEMFQPNGPLPGLPNGVSYDGPLGTPGMTPSGALAYAIAIKGPGVTPQNERVILADRDGALRLVLRAGTLVPEAGANLRLDWFDSLAFNEARHLAFRGRVTGPGVTSANEHTIWFNEGNATRLVVRNGEPAPGFGDQDVTFSYLGTPALDSDDSLVFFAQLRHGADLEEGIFSWNAADGLRKLVSSLEPAPGIDDDMYIRTMGIPVINGQGKVAFFGEACLQNDCSYGIWAQDGNGRFRLIAMEGQEFVLGPDDRRVVSNVEYSGSNGYEYASGNESGDRIILLDDGTLAFSAAFEDRTSGVFTIDTNAVPEPSTAWFAVLGAASAAGTVYIRRRWFP